MKTIEGAALFQNFLVKWKAVSSDFPLRVQKAIQNWITIWHGVLGS